MVRVGVPSGGLLPGGLCLAVSGAVSAVVGCLSGWCVGPSLAGLRWDVVALGGVWWGEVAGWLSWVEGGRCVRGAWQWFCSCRGSRGVGPFLSSFGVGLMPRLRTLPGGGAWSLSVACKGGAERWGCVPRCHGVRMGVWVVVGLPIWHVPRCGLLGVLGVVLTAS